MLKRTRLFQFRSPLLSESRLMSFPRATEMFQFTRFATHDYVFIMRYLLRGGFPHSEISGSKLICQLPEAYRRLSRPSSPVIAKASTTCTYSLDPITLTPQHRSGQVRSNPPFSLRSIVKERLSIEYLALRRLQYFQSLAS
jgi:hypothetical protein